IEERPFIHRRFQEMAVQAGIAGAELYTANHRMPEASAISGNKIVVSRTLLNLLNDQEVVAVIGHELGHCMHIKKHFALGAASKAGFIASGILSYMAVNKLLPEPKPQNAANEERYSRRSLFRRGAVKGTAAFLGAWAGGDITRSLAVAAREDEADDEGLKLHGDREAFMSALTKMAAYLQERGFRVDGHGYRNAQERSDRLER
ncbi:MAG: M48 family metalloprotease, partial [Pseudomonadota bacterium]|nr:M48 family metalloprotease [Pseudomonadota bacterium]